MGIFSKASADKETKKPAVSSTKLGTGKKAVAKKAEDKAVVKAEPKVAKATKATNETYANVIRNPRITEKAAHISDNNVYTFDVMPGASKTEIMKAIKAIYKLSPIKVNVSAIPTKRVFRANHIGVKRGGRKAYVYLKKGDKIEFI